MPTTTKGDSVSYGKKKTNSIPTWVPVALLAVTTVALAVPVVLLKRQRANALTNSAPPRRISTLPGLLTSTYRPIPEPSTESSIRAPSPGETEGLGFNGAFYSAKAFGIATLIVSLGASAGVWGVQSYLGVRNTEEFAIRMRMILLEKMPLLSSRIHRSTNEDGQVEEVIAQEDWELDTAEKRLTAAFEKDGFSGWGETMLKEVEAEARLERMKRGQIPVNSQSRDGRDSEE